MKHQSGAAARAAASPLLAAKDHGAPSVFRPEALLREARRQKNLPMEAVPPVCLLDPDGDIVRHLARASAARPHRGWACYHTELVAFDVPGAGPVGAVGCAVGAPFAVLVAEQLFASGCRLLVSVTSAGRIATDLPAAPHFILIERALRDEGASHHYLPPSAFAEAPDRALLARVEAALRAAGGQDLALLRGATWTTDAPFRETELAIAAARARGCLAVEMEAAALYAFAAARGRSVVCFAHVTNAMGRDEGDFEKGEADGAAAALQAVAATMRAFLPTPR